MRAQQLINASIKLTIGVTALAYLIFMMGYLHLELFPNFLISLILCTLITLEISKLLRESRKTERQLKELEMEAHKYDITGKMIETHLQDSNNNQDKELAQRLAKKASRAEKLRVLLAETGFEIALRIIRASRPKKA